MIVTTAEEARQLKNNYFANLEYSWWTRKVLRNAVVKIYKDITKASKRGENYIDVTAGRYGLDSDKWNILMRSGLIERLEKDGFTIDKGIVMLHFEISWEDK